MRVLMINSVCGIRSTGRICTDLADKYRNEGNEVRIAYGREAYVPKKYRDIATRIGNSTSVKIHAVQSRVFDNHGCGSVCSTRKFLLWAEEYNPDLLWLHNIHGYYINYELLFAWIKSRPQMTVKWTLHDCWAFTGHCTHFSYVKCEAWKTGCSKCPQIRRYPASLFVDNSQNNYYRKRAAFTGVKNLKIITPSQWLYELVKESFLKDYPVEVCYNQIDKNVFKPTESDFREKYGLNNKVIVLGVASMWDDRKGLGDFLKLSEMLDERYAIVLVGLSLKQLKKMPSKIVGIPRTNDVIELVKIYSAANVFVNPSKEETFGLTSAEAEACGTHSIVYENTACAEIAKMNGGSVLQDNIEDLFKAITGNTYSSENRGAGQ